MEFLKIIKDYFLVLRPLNLLIIFFTQYFIQFYFIIPRALDVTLDGILFPLFVLNTVIIAGSGYLINDIIDQSTDEINKPQNQYIGKSISEFAGYFYYLMLLIIGSLIAVYIAYKTDLWMYIWIYPAGIWAMYLYSRHLKGTILIGNIFVSLFISGVIGILGFAQFVGGYTLNSDIKGFIFAYMAFVFILNFIREIIKDVEDTEGDSKTDQITFVVKFGINHTKWLLQCLVIIAVSGLTFWIMYSFFETTQQYKIWILSVIIIPLLFSIYMIFKANTKKAFKQISLLLKLILVFGLMSILFIS